MLFLPSTAPAHTGKPSSMHTEAPPVPQASKRSTSNPCSAKVLEAPRGGVACPRPHGPEGGPCRDTPAGPDSAHGRCGNRYQFSSSKSQSGNRVQTRKGKLISSVLRSKCSRQDRDIQTCTGNPQCSASVSGSGSPKREPPFPAGPSLPSQAPQHLDPAVTPGKLPYSGLVRVAQPAGQSCGGVTRA